MSASVSVSPAKPDILNNGTGADAPSHWKTDKLSIRVGFKT